MESFTVFADEEWNNLSRIFSNKVDQYSIDQLHGHSHGLFPINVETPSTFWSTDESNNGTTPVFVFDDGLFLNYPFSQETSNSSGTGTRAASTNLFLPTPNYENYHNYSEESPMGFCGKDDQNNNFSSQVSSDDVMEEILCWKQAAGNNVDGQQMADHPGREMHMPLKRNFEMPELPQAHKDEVVQIDDQFDKSPKKKQRVSRMNNKIKKSAQSKKNPKIGTDTNGNERELETNNNDGNVKGPSLTSYCFEDNSDSNGSQESNGEEGLNLNVKTRASRGGATDPQSLLARKRRERINERLRILQNLVPNGTKVDTCTMLEEAVQYVRFLQLQIKLLSSEDMWMYAPIVYNGMDMGLY